MYCLCLCCYYCCCCCCYYCYCYIDVICIVCLIIHLNTYFRKQMHNYNNTSSLLWFTKPFYPIGKQLALSLEVTRYFRLYLKIGWTSVKPSRKHWILTRNNQCLHTWVPLITAYGWSLSDVKARCSLFTYSWSVVYWQGV